MAVYLLLPQIPMLFMGEEWNAAQPFPFFCDFGADLAEAVRKGRRQEFPEHRGEIPDPQDYATFASAKLRWEEVNLPGHAAWLDWYRRILGVRRRYIASAPHAGRYEMVGDGAVAVRWGTLALAANLSGVRVSGFPPAGASILWQEGEVERDGALGPWTVRWSR
jgi:1,4-alpha-glucan branching enzyme